MLRQNKKVGAIGFFYFKLMKEVNVFLRRNNVHHFENRGSLSYYCGFVLSYSSFGTISGVKNLADTDFYNFDFHSTIITYEMMSFLH